MLQFGCAHVAKIIAHRSIYRTIGLFSTLKSSSTPFKLHFVPSKLALLLVTINHLIFVGNPVILIYTLHPKTWNQTNRRNIRFCKILTCHTGATN